MALCDLCNRASTGYEVKRSQRHLLAAIENNWSEAHIATTLLQGYTVGQIGNFAGFKLNNFFPAKLIFELFEPYCII